MSSYEPSESVAEFPTTVRLDALDMGDVDEVKNGAVFIGQSRAAHGEWDPSTVPEPLGLPVLFKGAARGLVALVDTGATGTEADILVPMKLWSSLAKKTETTEKGQQAQGAGGEQITISQTVTVWADVRLNEEWLPIELRVAGASMVFNDECPALLTWTGVHRLDRK